MKKHSLLVFCLLSSFFMHAQKHEVGIMFGGANLISDIGKSSYIQSPLQENIEGDTDFQFFIAALYKRNLNPRFSLRGQFSYAEVVGNDLKSSRDVRKARGIGYDNNLLELALMFEYNFTNFNEAKKTAFSPFIFAGIAGLSHKNRKYKNFVQTGMNTFSSVEVEENYNLGYSIPFGAGLKYKFNFNWVLQMEVGFRTTSQDDLDYSNPDPEDIETGSGNTFTNEQALDLVSFGQAENNDWYVFTGISLLYTFGRAKCYNN